MSKTLIGLIFILVGTAYGSLALDNIYNNTLGWLLEHEWIKPPPPGKPDALSQLLGRKPLILLYSLALIIIGIFILWNRNN